MLRTDKPDFNRIKTILQHKEADRVPLAEASISLDIISAFLGKEVSINDFASQVKFWATAGYDFIPLSIGMMQPGKVTENSPISKVIRNYLKSRGETGENWNLAEHALIRNENDFLLFPWEEAAKVDLKPFYQVQPYLPEGMKIIALNGKIFTLSWLLMGYENFCINIMINPHFVQQVIEQVAQIQIQSLEKIFNFPNVAGVWTLDDLAFGTTTMIQPHLLRQYIFPWYQKLVRRCHENNLVFFFHSDGYIEDIMDDLIGLEIDALHPIDPTCMDIEEVKQKVGDRITLMGNISNEMLMRSKPEEVSHLVRERIKKIAPGGGYCLGSGNSVPDWAKYENYLAMIKTGLAYGKYPIHA